MTPLKQKWTAIKALNPETIVLVRIGKFYEVFGDDADTLHEVFQAPVMEGRHSGFPASCLGKFLEGLHRAGHRSVRLISGR